jgi:hypothetical protein
MDWALHQTQVRLDIRAERAEYERLLGIRQESFNRLVRLGGGDDRTKEIPIAEWEAAHLLARLNPKFSPDFFAALVSLDRSAEQDEVRNCRIDELSPGMMIQEEIRGHDGSLILSKGQGVTSTVIFRLKNLQSRRAIPARITVSLPSVPAACAKAAANLGHR